VQPGNQRRQAAPQANPSSPTERLPPRPQDGNGRADWWGQGNWPWSRLSFNATLPILINSPEPLINRAPHNITHSHSQSPSGPPATTEPRTLHHHIKTHRHSKRPRKPRQGPTWYPAPATFRTLCHRVVSLTFTVEPSFTLRCCGHHRTRHAVPLHYPHLSSAATPLRLPSRSRACNRPSSALTISPVSPTFPASREHSICMVTARS
jgi:hypothetical protein